MPFSPFIASRRTIVGMAVCGAISPAQPMAGSVSVHEFGARGDGVADDTAALQRALASGQSLFVPAGTYVVDRRLDLARRGQSIAGVGKASRIVQHGRGEDATLLRAVALGGHRLSGLSLQPGTVTDRLTFGYGIALFTSSGCRIFDCEIFGHRRGGIGLFDTSDCFIERNEIHDSVVQPGTGVTQSQTGCDIYVGGNSARNQIMGNRCLRGSGVGIAVQTLAVTDHADDNVISGNTIEHQDLYGVMLYVLRPGGTCRRTRVVQNEIANISGSIPEENGRFNYGSGIYLQSADNAVISGNRVTNTVTRSLAGSAPDLDNVPAAIGVSGRFDSVRIEGNTLDQTGWWAIAVVTPPDSTNQGTVAIRENNGTRLHRGAIYVLNSQKADIIANRMGGPGSGSAIQIRLTINRPGSHYRVDGNIVDDFEAGIEVVGPGAESAEITRNSISNNTGYAVSLHARTIICSDNEVTASKPTARGIVIGAEAQSGNITGNVMMTRYQAVEVARPDNRLTITANSKR